MCACCVYARACVRADTPYECICVSTVSDGGMVVWVAGEEGEGGARVHPPRVFNWTPVSTLLQLLQCYYTTLCSVQRSHKAIGQSH